MYRLGDGCTIAHGYAFSGMKETEDDSLPVVVNIGNFRYTGGFRFESTRIQRFDGEFPERFRLSPGDVLLAMTCQTAGGEILGIPGRIPADGREYLHNQRLGKVLVTRPDLLHLGYLYYLFLSRPFNAHLVATATGSKILHTAPARIESFVWNRPPLGTQRRIAEILSAYDDLIENNTKRIKILEEMARSLYREWFVNFRFPGHEKVKMVNSRLGRVPEGWEVAPLRSVLTVVRGKSYKSSELAESGGLPFINLKCFARDGGFRREGIKRFTGEAKPQQHVRPGDLVMAVTDMTQERRIVARAARVPRTSEPESVISMDVVRLVPENDRQREFWYAMLRFSSFSDEVKQHANGANVLHLGPDRIESFVASIPPADLVARFSRVLQPLLELGDVFELQSENLSRTRDLLLPRLISGELPVEAAARIAPARSRTRSSELPLPL